MRKILFIHGRSQGGKDPVALKKEWISAFDEGCDKAGIGRAEPSVVSLPYYGDRLDQLVAAMDAPLSDEIRTRGGLPSDEAYAQFREAVAEEVRKAAGIPDAEAEQYLSPDERARGPQNWEWVQAILRAIDQRFPGSAARLVERVTRDAWVYLTAPGVRSVIDDIVRADLTADETVVVGHSLGSLVGYLVLRHSTLKLNVVRYVTVGSPLGVQAIRRRLSPLAYPANVGPWYNAYDDRDVVALRALDSTSFPITPGITNSTHVKNKTDNRHGIIGYLDDPEVAKMIMG